LPNKLNYNLVKSSFDNEGYTLLSTEYVNSREKLKYKCPSGHYHSISWSKWQAGRRCPYCSGKVKKTLSFIRNEFSKEGYALLETSYVNAHEKLKCKCPNGHITHISWHNWNHGRRCGVCAGKVIDIHMIKNAFESEGYVLLSTEYLGAHSFLHYICPSGHKHKIRWHNWLSGRRCPTCSALVRRIPFDSIVKSLNAEGYELLNIEYVNSGYRTNTYVYYKCPYGHVGKIRYDQWSSGHRCRTCFMNGRSSQENALYEYICTLDSNVLRHDRKLIFPYELDIVCPDKKIAIEYCGLYWHSELAGKDKDYHVNKLNLCRKSGYRLLTIFEDEWVNKRDIVCNMLRVVMHNNSNKLYARECVIKPISVKDAVYFCNRNHLEGYKTSMIHLGAFYADNLMAVMLFSKASGTGDTYELNRFCIIKDHVIVGLASRMFNYFKHNYVWSNVLSYDDRRWYDGSLYDKIGFRLIGVTQPNCWYFKSGELERFRVFDLVNRSQSYNYIWDCGNLKYKTSIL